MTKTTVTSLAMDHKEALTVLTRMFGSSIDNAREYLVNADLSLGAWTGNDVVKVRRSPESGSFYVRFHVL